MCSTHPVPSKPKTSPLAAETTSTSARSPTVSGFGVHNPVAESNTSESASAGVAVLSTSAMVDKYRGDASHSSAKSFHRNTSPSSGSVASTSVKLSNGTPNAAGGLFTHCDSPASQVSMSPSSAAAPIATSSKPSRVFGGGVTARQMPSAPVNVNTSLSTAPEVSTSVWSLTGPAAGAGTG